MDTRCRQTCSRTCNTHTHLTRSHSFTHTHTHTYTHTHTHTHTVYHRAKWKDRETTTSRVHTRAPALDVNQGWNHTLKDATWCSAYPTFSHTLVLGDQHQLARPTNQPPTHAVHTLHDTSRGFVHLVNHQALIQHRPRHTTHHGEAVASTSTTPCPREKRCAVPPPRVVDPRGL